MQGFRHTKIVPNKQVKPCVRIGLILISSNYNDRFSDDLQNNCMLEQGRLPFHRGHYRFWTKMALQGRRWGSIYAIFLVSSGVTTFAILVPLDVIRHLFEFPGQDGGEDDPSRRCHQGREDSAERGHYTKPKD